MEAIANKGGKITDDYTQRYQALRQILLPVTDIGQISGPNINLILNLNPVLKCSSIENFTLAEISFVCFIELNSKFNYQKSQH